MLGKLTHKHIDTRTLRRHCLKAECWFANELSWWLILPFNWLVKGAIRIQCIDAHQERKTVGLGCLYIMCETVRFKVKHTLEHRRHVTHSLIIIIIIHSDYAFELLHDLKYESTSQCEYMWVTLHAGGFFFFFITFSSLFFLLSPPCTLSHFNPSSHLFLYGHGSLFLSLALVFLITICWQHHSTLCNICPISYCHFPPVSPQTRLSVHYVCLFDLLD